MIIRWLGAATVEISCGGRHILVDPYFQVFSRHAKQKKKAIKKALSRADVVLITHPHLDHFSDIREIAELTGAPIYVSRGGVDIAEGQGANVSNIRVLRDGMDIGIDLDIRVHVWCSRHIRFDKRLVAKTLFRAFLPSNFFRGVHLGQQNRRFRITDADVFAFEIIQKEKRVFLLGSANLCQDETYPSGCDCLVYPYQGRSDLERYSRTIIKCLKPKKILLSHFDDAFPPISARVDTAAFCAMYKNSIEPEFGRPIKI